MSRRRGRKRPRPFGLFEPPLPAEEYIEQRHFFREFRRRLADGVPSQEFLKQIRDEILATTKLPHAIDYLLTEMLHSGRLADAMRRLDHYFTPFQTFVVEASELDRARFDQRVAFAVLERLAAYSAKRPDRPGLFIYQFESVARNRLGYDRSLEAIAADPAYGDDWREWIASVRKALGAVEFADLVYRRSERARLDRRRQDPDYEPTVPILFGEAEGRIARANIGKDPLYMFSAFQRQLGYPRVPRPKVGPQEPVFHPALEERLQRIEKRIAVIDAELKGDLKIEDLAKKSPPDWEL
ncbi:MAG: hypothetical protein AAF532_02500 [Planctomycetota bacterium]